MSWFRAVWAFLVRWVPFGILSTNKPRHFREMFGILWENRGRWGYAWRILNHGVCDGCSLGPRGLRDDVIPGTHLCLTRLKLLRLNTMRVIPASRLHRSDGLSGMSNEQLHQLGRIPYPMIRKNGEDKFTKISWDEATALIANKIKSSDPDRRGMFVSSRGLTNEAYYMLQKLWRIGGSPHIDSCARLCHAASGVGLGQTIGYGAPTISLSDLIGADVIFVIGSNLPNNKPVSTKYLRAARKAGSRVIVVNPFKEPAMERYWIPSIPSSAVFGTKLMDDFVPVRPGGDIAFISGMLKALDEIDGWNEKYISEMCTGADELRARLKTLPWSELVDDSGIDEEEMRRIAKIYAAAKTAVIVYSMGLTQYEFGVENVKMVVNLALSRGMIGREKCGILPIRGHSGVQGTAECGADATKLPGGLPINEENCDKLEKHYQHEIPRRIGLQAGHLLDHAGKEGLDLLYLVGGNHLENMPNRAHARMALEQVGLRVHQDILINSSALLPAKEAVLLLPAETRYEQRSGGTSTSTERRIRYTPEIPGPRIKEARPEWEIPQLIGQKLLPDRKDLFHFQDTTEIRQEMSEVMPLYAGIETLEKEGDWVQWGGERLGASFPNMPDGKAKLTTMDIPRVEVPEGQFLLHMRRGKQFNSITYGAHDPITNTKRSSIILDPRDMQDLGLTEGDAVVISNENARMFANAKSGPCRRSHVQGFWPECNVLLSQRYDPASGEPDYNTAVMVERAPFA